MTETEQRAWEVFGAPVMAQGPYRVIYADPPWPTLNRRGPLGGTHYPLMGGDEIANLPISRITDDNCVLLLWVTWPNLSLGMQIIDAWGFTYLTGMPWIKVTKDGNGLHIGMGRWFRECSELLLIGRRGRVDAPQPAIQGAVWHRRGTVSRKPEEVAQWAMRMPGPYLELFARRPRPGWVVWGNEVESG